MSENGEVGKLSDRERSLLDDNISLKTQLKELETTFGKMQADFTRSIKMRERLDSLCKVLQKQTQDIKDESTAQIGNAEGHGNKLAQEVAENMSMMEDVNTQLGDIMNESLKAKQENVDLTGEVGKLKEQYDGKHEELTKELEKANDDLIKTKTDLAQLRLKSAEDREQTYGEMHRAATTLVEHRMQMKNAKELELELRQMLQSYEQKFSGLQGTLQDTNTAYSTFMVDMDKVASRTRELETETNSWQKKWELNNSDLVEITHKHQAIQIDVMNVHESLMKMTNLYQQLTKERTELTKKLGREEPPPPPPPIDPAVIATIAAKSPTEPETKSSSSK